MKNHAYLLVITWLLVIYSCNSPEKSKTLNINKNEFIRIKSWTTLGPFINSDTILYDSIKSIDEDFLKYFKTSETEVNWKTFKKLNQKNCELKSVLGKGFNNETVTTNLDIIDLAKHYPEQDIRHNTAYLACNVFSDSVQNVYFLYNACELTKLYCNGNLLKETPYNSSFSTHYLSYVPVTLKKGNNFILVKLTKFRKKRLKMIFDIAGEDYAYTSYFRDFYFDFLKNPIVNNNTLYINLASFKSQNKLSYNIYNLNNETIYNSNEIAFQKQKINELKIELNKLNDGLYKIDLITDSTFSQYFFKGDINKKIQQLESDLNKNCKNEHLKKMLIERTSYLSNKKGDDMKLFWTRNLIEHVRQLEQLCSKKVLTELRFETYSSSVDNHVNSYLYYVSEEQLAKNTPLALMIVLPYNFSDYTPMHRSFYASNVDQIPWDCYYSEKNNFTLLYLNLRGTNGACTFAETDFFDVLNDVKSKYNIDTTKIFLMSDCTGGTKVLQLAAHYPHYFTGLALDGPITNTNRSSTYQDLSNNPINLIENFRNHHIYIAHSKHDDTSPFSLSEQFVKKLETFNKSHIFNILPGNFHSLSFHDYHKYDYKYLTGKQKKHENSFTYSLIENKHNNAYWCNIKDIVFGKKASLNANYNNNIITLTTQNINEININLNELDIKKDQPIKVIVNNQVYFNKITTSSTINITLNKEANSLYKNSKWEGPISDLFNKKIVLVRGTIGNNVSTERIDTCINRFQKKWNSKYFGEFDIIDDVTVVNRMNSRTNYILFGNKNTNAIIKQLQNKLPIIEENDFVRINNEQMPGKTICFNYVYPNTIVNNGYFLIVGSNNNNIVEFYSYDIEKTGIDYIIWNLKNTEKVNAGYFDEYWKLVKI